MRFGKIPKKINVERTKQELARFREAFPKINSNFDESLFNFSVTGSGPDTEQPPDTPSEMSTCWRDEVLFVKIACDFEWPSLRSLDDFGNPVRTGFDMDIGQAGGKKVFRIKGKYTRKCICETYEDDLWLPSQCDESFKPEGCKDAVIRNGKYCQKNGEFTIPESEFYDPTSASGGGYGEATDMDKTMPYRTRWEAKCACEYECKPCTNSKVEVLDLTIPMSMLMHSGNMQHLFKTGDYSYLYYQCLQKAREDECLNWILDVVYGTTIDDILDPTVADNYGGKEILDNYIFECMGTKACCGGETLPPPPHLGGGGFDIQNWWHNLDNPCPQGGSEEDLEPGIDSDDTNEALEVLMQGLWWFVSGKCNE